MAIGARRYPKPVKQVGLGYLPLPHGSIPWHFRHEGIEGNGFNGVIRHAWRVQPKAMAMPGKGFIKNG